MQEQTLTSRSVSNILWSALKLAGYGNVVRPTYGANYNVQLSLTFMFPKGK